MKNRIEYLDALRGFVMLLVVLAHVPMYCYHHVEGVSFSMIPTTFHLALFFFISGWFNSRAVRNADATLHSCYENGSKKAVNRKFVQLIVPTVVFYLLYCWIFEINVIDNLWNDKYKAGYWFCIVLFGFNLLMIVLGRLHGPRGAFWGLLFSLGAMMLNTNAVTRLLAEWNIPNVLCVQQWQYFIFFYLGCLAHRHQERFFALLDNGRVMAIGILVFFGSLMMFYHQPVGLFCIKAEFLVWGCLGIVLSIFSISSSCPGTWRDLVRR